MHAEPRNRETCERLRADALRIWQAGVEAVRSDRLVREHVQVSGDTLELAGHRVDLRPIGRIIVVGCGKAGAGMAAGLELALGDDLLRQKHVDGWINVPADCVRALGHIHLHAARPAGVNEPTLEGAQGAAEIMRRVGELRPNDLCIALISGGGSALLPLPIAGIALEDKLAVTRFLSAAGSPIEELNTVRKQLSQIKGGGLARACGAAQLIALIISDVLGDPLDLIASGPTVEDPSTPDDALDILSRHGAEAAGIPERVFQALEQRRRAPNPPAVCQVTNVVIGNNGLAVAAAAQQARELGYRVTSESAERSEGAAEDVGRRLAEWALSIGDPVEPTCLISGGEPTVKLVAPDRRGRGGRNQQLVLSAVERLQAEPCSTNVLILSGGTDGEDGPTDAAGAWADRAMMDRASEQTLDVGAHLERNDAYRWFEPLGGLIKSGPTHTNVCDVRVVLVAGDA